MNINPADLPSTSVWTLSFYRDGNLNDGPFPMCGLEETSFPILPMVWAALAPSLGPQDPPPGPWVLDVQLFHSTSSWPRPLGAATCQVGAKKVVSRNLEVLKQRFKARTLHRKIVGKKES